MFAAAGSTLNIYNLNEGDLEAAPPFFPKSGEDIKKIQWCHDNTYIALLGCGGTVEIVSSKDTNDIKSVHIITAFQQVSALSFKWKTKKILALGNALGEVVMYDTKNRIISKYLAKFSSTINDLEFSSNGHYLVVLYDKNVVIFDLLGPDTGFTELRQPDISIIVSFYQHSPEKIAVGCQNGTILIWDLILLKEVARYERHKKEVTSIKTCNFDKILTSTGMDNKLCFLDGEDAASFKNIKALYQPITSMDVSPENDYIIVGLEDGTLYIYDLNDHIKPLITPKLYTQGPVNDVSFANADDLEVMPIFKVTASLSPELSPRSFKSSKICTSTEDSMISSCVQETDNENQETTTNNEENHIKTTQKETFITEEQAKMLFAKMIKTHFDKLEDQLNDQTAEFEMFIANEFDAIREKFSRWNVFNVGDTNDVLKKIQDMENQTAVSSVSKRNP